MSRIDRDMKPPRIPPTDEGALARVPAHGDANARSVPKRQAAIGTGESTEIGASGSRSTRSHVDERAGASSSGGAVDTAASACFATPKLAAPGSQPHGHGAVIEAGSALAPV
jgi:hypothetical protein